MRQTTTNNDALDVNGKSHVSKRQCEGLHRRPPHLGGHRISTDRLLNCLRANVLTGGLFVAPGDTLRGGVNLQAAARPAATGLATRKDGRMTHLAGAEGRAAPQASSEHESHGNTGTDGHHEEGRSPTPGT